MDDMDNIIYDENDIEDFDEFLKWHGISTSDDEEDGNYDDDEIKELYF